MEIKVGDKVRVSKDAPIHIIGSASEIKCKAVVLGTDADIAVIGFRTREKQRYDAYEIPTKYLIKVDAEAKEPRKPSEEVKVGDVIDTPKGKGIVRISYGDYWVVQLDNGVWYIHTETNMPSAPYTEPTEQTEADANEKLQEEYARFMSEHTRISLADRIEREHIQPRMRVLSQEDFLKDFDPWEHKITPERPTYEVTVDNVTINWQRYEADLAKEIAVKLSNPNENKPGYVADYAVLVAKAVVENLKKK